MKCYLHIGTEKTATTTLQEFLHLNRDLLSSFRICYAKSMGLTNNWKLALAAYNPHRRDNFTRKNGISTDGELINYQQGILRELDDELSLVSQQVVVFSSEHFQSRLTEINEIQRLKDILIGSGVKEFSVIIYLRNPAELANSLYSTAIKFGATIDAPPLPDNEYYNHICNHKKTLENFAAVFGTEALVPRIFERGELNNDSLIEDFMALIGAPWSDEYLLPENLNAGMSALGIALFSRFNRHVSEVTNGKNAASGEDVIRFFEQNFISEKYSMPEALYLRYDETFATSNEWVRKKWFPDKSSLFSKKHHPAEVDLQFTDAELNKISAVFAKNWISKNGR